MPLTKGGKVRDTDPLVDELYEIRLEQNLTQAELCRIMGANPVTLNNIERGYNAPSLQTLRRIANALGYDIALVRKG